MLVTIIVLLSIIMLVAYTTYAERKVLAAMQRRVGPRFTGIYGLLQPLADALKLLHKTLVIPKKSRTFIFILAPIITLVCALMPFAILPYEGSISSINLGVLYILAMGSLGVYGVLLGGLASGSRYPLLGGLRAAAQMISYEISLVLLVLSVCLYAKSFNLIDIVHNQDTLWHVLPLCPLCILYCVLMLAETHRAPFDLPEAEAELVAGYNVEYSSILFAFYFLGEYAHILFMSVWGAILFLGGWLPPVKHLEWIPGYIWLAIKACVFIFIFFWTRGTLPRVRYDQLMKMGWKYMLPAVCIIFIALTYVRRYT